MIFQFALFLILGWCAFANPQGPTRTVLMVVYAVLMILWLVFGLGGFEIPRLTR